MQILEAQADEVPEAQSAVPPHPPSAWWVGSL
jgi:hypothetical protein